MTRILPGIWHCFRLTTLVLNTYSQRSRLTWLTVPAERRTRIRAYFPHTATVAMTTPLQYTELLTLRSQAWSTLEARYASDPTFRLLNSIDLQLSAMASTQHCSDPAEVITAAAVIVFRTRIHQPVLGRDILAELRGMGVPLPENDRRATATVTAVFGKRPGIFKKFPGPGGMAISRWHLQSMVRSSDDDARATTIKAT
jgi:hypothetical protein